MRGAFHTGQTTTVLKALANLCAHGVSGHEIQTGDSSISGSVNNVNNAKPPTTGSPCAYIWPRRREGARSDRPDQRGIKADRSVVDQLAAHGTRNHRAQGGHSKDGQHNRGGGRTQLTRQGLRP